MAHGEQILSNSIQVQPKQKKIVEFPVLSHFMSCPSLSRPCSVWGQTLYLISATTTHHKTFWKPIYVHSSLTCLSSLYQCFYLSLYPSPTNPLLTYPYPSLNFTLLSSTLYVLSMSMASHLKIPSHTYVVPTTRKLSLI